MKKENAITLVALVITVVILIILAGTSIVLFAGNNGLLSKIQKVSESEEAKIKEEIELAISEIQIENIPKRVNVTLEMLANGELEHKLQGISFTYENNKITGKYRNITFEIDSNLKVSILKDIIFDYKLIPDGYTNEDVILKLDVTSAGGQITKIKEPDNILKNNDGTYTIKNNGDYQFYIEDSTGRSKTATVTIDTIDRLAPIDFEPIISNVGLTTISVIPNAIDALCDEENAESGIARYEYYIKSKDQTEYDKYESTDINYTFTRLDKNKQYSIYVIAYDKAKNFKKSSTVEVTTKDNILDYAILTEYGVMNYLDDDESYCLDLEVEPKKSDALKLDGYDGEVSTYIDAYNKTLKVYIDESVRGKKVYLKLMMKGNNGSYKTYVKFYNTSSQESTLLSRESGGELNINATYDIPEDAEYLVFTGNNSLYVYEVRIADEPKIDGIQTYPKLTEYGIESGYCTATITYANTSVQKLYKINDGEWQKYENTPIRVELDDVLYAKGIDKNGKETRIESNYKSSLPKDALGRDGYDNVPTTYIDAIDQTLKVYIDESARGKKVYLKLNMNGSNGSYKTYVKFYKTSSPESTLLSRERGGWLGIDNTYDIPEDAEYIVFTGNNNLYVYEVKIADEPKIDGTQFYPKLTEGGIESGYCTASITYSNTSVQKLYKINDGEWQNYENAPIRVELDDVLYAKGIDKNGKETRIESNYKSSLPKDALGSEGYDNIPTTYIDAIDQTLKVYIDESARGKKVYLKLDMKGNNGSYKTYVKFYNTSSKESTLLSRESGGFLSINASYNIPEDAEYIVFTGNNNLYVYEIGKGQ